MAYKSFLALHIAHCICTGSNFFNHKVFTTGKVIYVCGEGQGALSRRIRALKITKSGFNNNLKIWNKPINIDDKDSMETFKILIQELNPALVIFDTFASLVSGKTDENSPSAVGQALRLIKETCRNGKTSSLIVHHFGKDAAKGFRGASNFINDMDFCFEMKREANSMNTTLSCIKMKDGESSEDIQLVANVIELGIYDQEGMESTSLVLASTEFEPQKIMQQRS